MAGIGRKAPRFFCDNCGAEVPLKARNCPGCGRFFASVRCPTCGFSAEEERFKNGCPLCGYSAPPGSGIQWPLLDNPDPANTRQAAGPLPLWVYILAAAALLGIFTTLILL